MLDSGSRLGPYEILAPLGAGGMGEVYRARDRKLDRDVAIKVLPESVAAEPDRLARFEREAKAVAALSHPNILAIHDFGTHEGVAYAVMELLEGETLRARLAAGPLPQKETVDYAQQIARGLSAAHEKGIVHRDLKPENLFVARGGHVKILDFGLAKRSERVRAEDLTSAPTQEQQTEPGTVMGSVGYMSPEQVRGLPVDVRSDIFSFGAVLYEMLTGRRAFTGSTPADTMSEILKEDPPQLSNTGRIITPALDRIIRHCLEKDTDARFQSARDVAFALSEVGTSSPGLATPAKGWARKRALTAAIAVLAILSFATVLILKRFPRGARELGVKRIAVLPFENLGSPEDDYFTDGMADEVRGKLTTLPGLEVIARGSSNPYKKTTKTPAQIGRELEVQYLLTATVRWQKGGGASRVHFTPELVELKSSGAPVSKWQQPFDAPLTDVFQVQADIAARVVQSLGVALGAGDEKRLRETPTANLAAYDAFLKGESILWQWKNGFQSPQDALALYEQAVALDPGFGRAWAAVSMASSKVYGLGPSEGARERARVAAEKAMALSPDLPDAYEALAEYSEDVVPDNRKAVENARKARRLAPGSARILQRFAGYEYSLGHVEEALKQNRRVERLDPRDPGTKSSIGHLLIVLGHVGEAREVLDQGLALSPNHLPLITNKALSFVAEGDLAGARNVVTRASKQVDPTVLVTQFAQIWDLVWLLDEQLLDVLLRLTPSAFPNRELWAMSLTQGYALKGDTAMVRKYAEEARAALEGRLLVDPRYAQTHAYLGLALAYLGRREEAIREGQRAVALTPPENDQMDNAYFRYQLAWAYTLLSEPEKAISEFESLLKIPSIISRGWLMTDPKFEPLRKNPRFQKLAGEKS